MGPCRGLVWICYGGGGHHCVEFLLVTVHFVIATILSLSCIVVYTFYFIFRKHKNIMKILQHLKCPYLDHED